VRAPMQRSKHAEHHRAADEKLVQVSPATPNAPPEVTRTATRTARTMQAPLMRNHRSHQ
jgi:hypothetical protein